MKRFIKPNWKKSSLNISATLAEFLGVQNNKTTLKFLKKELKKNYKNIVFICLDGMGINPININLEKSDFLRKNIKMKLTSTFPSTTTNATTSLTSNKYPLEHGWFGWSLYFEKIGKNVDIYMHRDSQTGEKVDFKYPIIDNGDCYFDNAKSDYEINAVLPNYVQTKSIEKKVVINNIEEMCKEIDKICKKDGKQFVYTYLPEPDYTMHEFGVSSSEAKEVVGKINYEIEKLYNDLSDTLVVITADHGQVDIQGSVEFYKDKEINEMLTCVPFLDARSPAFKVKEGKNREFEKLFKQRYGKDFKLYKSKDLIKRGLFGKSGDFGELLGDYIAIGTYTHKDFVTSEHFNRFKGHHTSLTEEMLVPLIILKKK